MKRTPLAKRGKNYEKNREKQFGTDGKREWIISLPCVVCRRSPVDPHHEPPRSLGGKSKDLVPLCRRCHWETHNLAGTPHRGLERFEVTAARLEALWQAKKVCKTCAEVSLSGIKPSHNGSPNCQSGSIASGGTRAHCTCNDGCF